MINTTHSYSNQRIRLSIILILLAIVALIPYKILFDESHPVCVHLYLFGFQCPLCGMTRAVHQFAHLHIISAINHNFVVVLLPLYFAMDIATLIFKRNWLNAIKKVIVYLILTGLLALYAFRIGQHFNYFKFGALSPRSKVDEHLNQKNPTLAALDHQKQV
jgi:hypothetical protein